MSQLIIEDSENNINNKGSESSFQSFVMQDGVPGADVTISDPHLNECTEAEHFNENLTSSKDMAVPLHDMCDDVTKFDSSDEENDSDWVPLKHCSIRKWFCTNCTIVNFDDVELCNMCGEHKKSSILNHGFFASPLVADECSFNVMPDLLRKCREQRLKSFASEKTTAIGFDERMLLHSEVTMKSFPHLERPDRLCSILVSLAKADIFPGKCCLIPAREITEEELRVVHSLEHIGEVELTSQSVSSYFTPDTYTNEHSACAARLAAGTCADLAAEILSGCIKNGFALVRPPGHHARVRHAMGFCLYNNAAVAACAALAAGAKKVLIVDWDVHHGNGTQEIFERSKSVLYVSLHRHDRGRFYPGTGAVYDVGSMDGEGFSVNIPWTRGGVGDNDYIFAFHHVILPIACEFAPDITIISAGFDAAKGDPLGRCNVTPNGFACMTRMLDDVSSGKLLVILEGGYNLRSISSSATAVCKVLLGDYPDKGLMDSCTPSISGVQTVLDVLKVQAKFWHTLHPTIAELVSQYGALLRDKGKCTKRGQRKVVPVSWQWGRRRTLFRMLYGGCRAFKPKHH